MIIVQMTKKTWLFENFLTTFDDFLPPFWQFCRLFDEFYTTFHLRFEDVHK
jgi:hypothetical protein